MLDQGIRGFATITRMAGYRAELAVGIFAVVVLIAYVVMLGSERHETAPARAVLARIRYSSHRLVPIVVGCVTPLCSGRR